MGNLGYVLYGASLAPLVPCSMNSRLSLWTGNLAHVCVKLEAYCHAPCYSIADIGGIDYVTYGREQCADLMGTNREDPVDKHALCVIHMCSGWRNLSCGMWWLCFSLPCKVLVFKKWIKQWLILGIMICHQPCWIASYDLHYHIHTFIARETDMKVVYRWKIWALYIIYIYAYTGLALERLNWCCMPFLCQCNVRIQHI